MHMKTQTSSFGMVPGGGRGVPGRGKNFPGGYWYGRPGTPGATVAPEATSTPGTQPGAGV
jgi:hypothetical protein